MNITLRRLAFCLKAVPIAGIAIIAFAVACVWIPLSLLGHIPFWLCGGEYWDCHVPDWMNPLEYVAWVADGILGWIDNNAI